MARGVKKPTKSKPRIRIVHQLARSGGTIMSRCIGSLPGVVLLSEVNPRAPLELAPHLDPLFQASFWFRLFSHEVEQDLRKQELGFADKIEFIVTKAAEREEVVVLRDWTYIDFTSKPYYDTPTYSLSTAEALAERFTVQQVFTVRHPLHQWLSWKNFDKRPADIDVNEFMKSCMRFAQIASRHSFFRYEDFLADPDRVMENICSALDLSFDPIYNERWPHYHTITGDPTPHKTIKQRQSYRVDPNLWKEFRPMSEYKETELLLGYKSRGAGAKS